MELTLTEGYRVSYTRNKFTAIGCDTSAFMSDSSGLSFESGCYSSCNSPDNVLNGSCSGIGCCQTAIPKDVQFLNLSITNRNHHNTIKNFNRCSYSFLADNDWFTFYVSDLWNFSNRVEYNHENGVAPPVVIDWAIRNLTCKEAQRNQSSYACRQNASCIDSSNGPGYLCRCNEGYEGNPYLENGCQDIDECAHPEKNSCFKNYCRNTIGSYDCYCPASYYGDGINVTKGGSGCTYSKKQVPVMRLILGPSSGIFFLFIVSSWIYWVLQKRKLIRLKEKFFQQNGGMLLQQHLTSCERSAETTKIFTSEELRKATDNYHESHILGRGGYGTVFKGILSDKRIVAIKKSKIVDKNQIEQFINEVFILSQINHRNVVKLLGCCLETEVPLLVYEYIENGTLYNHIHSEHKSSLSWRIRLRIAAETAEALAYLHSFASQPIIHRDVKSTNILLNNQYTSKVSDFGASRLVALDQTQLSTLVQGTMGYLDPEYLHTSILTDKSDIYSFGVVLVELLTGKKVLCFEKPEEERNLAMFFVSTMKQNRLIEVLDVVVKEGDIDQIQEVANLAKRCLRLSGEERPSMKEVAMELEGLRLSEKHAWIEQNPQETEHLLGQSPGYFDYSNAGYDSMTSNVRASLHIGR
ncbi:hypothetical protein Sjap_021806 [Stephania japonica]|uniref:Uncharacterized protein n=1 Tax=Stephania japonica TaxID=461633 RepID=A0AAP0EWG6_9MAGN